MPLVGAALRVARRAILPIWRAVIGPRRDSALQLLAERLATRLASSPASDRPLHVGLLCVFGDEPVGGIPVWTRILGAALARQGHRVSLFHLARKDDRVEEQNGLTFVPVRTPSLRRWPALPPMPPWLQDYQRAVCGAVLTRHASDPFDIVSGPIWFAEPLALLRTGAVPIAVSLHTSQAMLSAIAADQAPETKALVLAERELLQRAPIIIGNSQAAASEILAATGVAFDAERIRVVPHGLADHAGAGASEGDGRVRLLFVGRLEHRKGIDTLLDALPVLVEREDVVIDIAGGPSDVDPVPAFRARHAGQPWLDRVRFHGGVDDATKWRLIAAADIAVIPSRYESFGLVAVEAMMFGKPVISTTAGGIPEVVEHGVTGLLVPPGDAQALADAMRGLIDDADLRARMGEAGRALYLAKFTDTAMADAWVAAIREGLARVAARRQ